MTPVMSGLISEQGNLWALMLGTTFDVRNIEAEAWFQDYTATFARNCTLKTEETVKGVISQALEDGWSIGKMQKNLGLVFEQWQEGGVSREELQWLQARMPDYRKEMIARTETIRASNRGNVEHFARWGVEGKEWLTARDDRLCPWCAEMDGKVINVTEPFFEQGDVFEVTIGEGENVRVASLKLDYETVTSPPLHPF